MADFRWFTRCIWGCLLLAAIGVGPALGQTGDRLLLVGSTTQIADFSRQIVGDRWEVRSVLAAGQDPHLYSVKTSDAALVSRADLCIENGWHLEGKHWMRTLAQDANKPLVTCVTGVEPLRLEEKTGAVDDPHAWFRVQNAAQYVRNILNGVSQIDPEHKQEYKARADLYLNQLQALHVWIIKQATVIPRERRILVTSHDAFNYFCQEYGFEPAAPVGWSTDELASGLTGARRQETIDSIRRFGVQAIFVETSVNEKVIRQIASDAGVRVGGTLYSDSMGPADSAGETYVGMMRENVLTIVQSSK